MYKEHLYKKPRQSWTSYATVVLPVQPTGDGIQRTQRNCHFRDNQELNINSISIITISNVELE